MKVKLEAQTINSLVADALEFLQRDMKLESFQNCSGIIMFIRSFDKLLEFLTSRHPMMKVFKSPIKLTNLNSLRSQVRGICDYLLNLRAGNGELLVNQRRRAFILGLVSTTKSTISMSEELLPRNNELYKFLFSYKFSQDHIDFLFSCIRARGRSNNNPKDPAIQNSSAPDFDE